MQELSTAGLAFGNGQITQRHSKAYTESYNGTSWTEVNDLTTGRASVGAAGSQTAALCFGGYSGAEDAETEEWDGTCWSEVADLNTARGDLGGSGSSTAAASLW